MRYGRSRKCVSSKAALLILLWSFVIGLLSGLFLNPDLYLTIVTFSFPTYGGVVVFTCFFPLAGFCADIQYGRYKTVVHDSPGEDRTLFIHWYVWIFYVGILVDQLAWNLVFSFPYNISLHAYYNIVGYCFLAMPFLLVIVVLPITLCLA